MIGRNGAVDLVILDCDGVLIDSEPISVRIDAEVLAEVGWPLSEQEIVRRFVGRSHAHMVAEIEAHLGRKLPASWNAETGPRYRQAFEAELRAMPGIEAALDALPVPACVASSSSHERLAFTLGLVGLYDRFAGRIFSATAVARGKPAPDLFWHAAERCGVAPSACVVVEDAPSGIEAARAAGMRSVGYAGGLVAAELLAGPDTVVITDMAELPEVVAAMAGATRSG